MKTRFIKIPAPAKLVDRSSGEPLGDSPVTMGDILERLTSGPKWAQTICLIRASDSIMKAYAEAVEAGSDVMLVREKDWEFLRESAENPKCMQVLPDGQAQVIYGLGYLPAVTPQLLPFLDAIIEASARPPRDEG